MDPFIGAAMIAGGAGLLGNMLGFSSQQQTNADNMELAKYQWEKNLEMWHLQNQYNLPKNQMARLKSAGLNPNLVYGSGNVGGNAASQPPQYQAPTMQAYTNFGDLGASAGIDAYFRAKQTKAQIENTEADTANKKTENHVIAEDWLTKHIKNLREDLEYENDKTRREFLRDQLKSALAYQDALTNNLISMTGFRDNVQAPNVMAQTGLLLKQAGVADATIDKLQSDIVTSAYERALIVAKINQTKEETERVKYETKLKKLDYEIESNLKRTLVDYGVSPKGSIYQQIGYTLKRFLDESTRYFNGFSDDIPIAPEDTIHRSGLIVPTENYYRKRRGF